MIMIDSRLKEFAIRNRDVHNDNFPLFPWNFTEEEKGQMRVKSAMALEDLNAVECALHDMEVGNRNF